VDPSSIQVSADALAPLATQPEWVPDDLDQPVQDSPDDATDRSALFGRYTGQINARVFRAWLRPRTPIGSLTFSCRARIEQDPVGNVKEVTLESCNGDTRWQLSVVRAIQSASPLPAPPDPKVFRREVTVALQSEGYHDGAASGDFEVPEIPNAQAMPQNRQDGEFTVTRTAEGIAIRITGHRNAADDPSSTLEPNLQP
jgi:hypothetical protein